MPMMADLDDPPRSRTPGMLIGLLVASPVAVIVLVWVIPTLVRAVLGGAQDLDARLRQDDVYMTAICTEAMTLPRDEALCQCVLAVEFPSLDCQAPFRRWAVERQHEACAVPEAAKGAKSFCTCVDVVADKFGASVMRTGEPADAQDASDPAAGEIVAAYERCEALPDALALPDPASLAPEPAAAAEPVEQ